MPNEKKTSFQIVGISKLFPHFSSNFKQLQVQNTFIVPEEKPDIESILCGSAYVNIKEKYIISTPKAVSIETQRLTGKKIIIEGEIIQKIEYIGNDKTQSVHAVHFITLFSSYIILNENLDTESNIVVTPYIEDVYIKQLNTRKIFANIMLLLDAKDLRCI